MHAPNGIESTPQVVKPALASVPSSTPIRKVVIITGGLNLHSVRKGIVELARNFPQIEWMLLENAPQKSVRVLLRNQWRNIRKNGWRWVPYQAWEVIASLLRKSRRMPPVPGSPPGAQYSVR